MTYTDFAFLWSNSKTEVIPGEPNINNGLSEFDLIKGADDQLSM